MCSAGLPHVLIKSDHYQGYHIPKGALVIANIWSVTGSHPSILILKPSEITYRAITQNPAVYEDPQTFCPERYIDGNALDAREMVFGFGRR
jgi:cytochrome P450